MKQKHPHPATVPPPKVVDSQETLEEMVGVLYQEPYLAVDTESNSLYAYHEQVCLIQISIPGTNYLVDPLAIDNLASLGPLFASDEIGKVFHAADYDIMMLNRDFNFQCTNLFDTMWAARILGWPHVGLADIMETYFGVHANKRFQRYNWGKRPLDKQALTYAWMDSYYLLELRAIQKQELIDKDRWEEAIEIFDYLCDHAENHHVYTSSDYFWRIKGIHNLNLNEQKRLYQLHLWREDTASKLDRPTVKVISNKRLVRLARIQPRNKQELFDAGLTRHQVRRFGSAILKAMRNKLSPIPPPSNTHERPAPDVIDRYNTLKAWRKDIAFHRGVDSDVILPNAVLWEIAHHPPQCLDDLLSISGIGPWRKTNYGPDILKLVSNRS